MDISRPLRFPLSLLRPVNEGPIASSFEVGHRPGPPCNANRLIWRIIFLKPSLPSPIPSLNCTHPFSYLERVDRLLVSITLPPSDDLTIANRSGHPPPGYRDFLPPSYPPLTQPDSGIFFKKLSELNTAFFRIEKDFPLFYFGVIPSHARLSIPPVDLFPSSGVSSFPLKNGKKSSLSLRTLNDCLLET